MTAFKTQKPTSLGSNGHILGKEFAISLDRKELLRSDLSEKGA